MTFGVLEPIVKFLQTARAPTSQNRRDYRGTGANNRRLTEEEEVRLQALQLLAIFANGRLFTHAFHAPPSNSPARSMFEC